MKMSTVPVATFFLSVVSLAATLPASATDASSTNAQASKVRIVRLSEVRGEVKVDRAIDRGFEPATANLPVIEQSKVQTAMGVAEIEFEDNSTVRLGPDTLVEFPQLDRTSTGATSSTMRLVKGTAYVALMKNRADAFTVMFGDRKLALPAASHVRLQVTDTEAKLAVFDGSVNVDAPSGQLVAPKKKTVVFNLSDQAEPTVNKGIAEEAILDDWDKQNTAYHARAASFSAFNSPYSYGLNDMAYYGSFMNAGGCGTMWRPYFVSAAWDPYANGSWAWYSGGYTWVSPYPWGWTPYHYGSWSYCPGTGWGWLPGGGWNGLNNVAMMPASSMTQPTVKSPVGPPLRPINPPRPGNPTMVAVNMKPLVRSEIMSGTSFQFRRDSAGFGVPRQTLGNLNKFSQQASSKGVASTPVYITGPANSNMQMGTRPNMNSGAGIMAAGSIHRGYAPSQSGPGTSPGYSASSPGMGAGRGAGGPVSSGGGASSSRMSSGPGASGGPSSAPAGHNH